ncbi:MAG: hypothetical protein K2M19_01970 [Muribaculaceae bacterium]|nr:hypothetical protein [Muribaculaceae bacterium]
MMTKHTILTAALLIASLGASADTEKMYLVKGDRVVAKYDVDAVDYISFKLPDDVFDESIWLTLNNVGKNTVTYTVNTADNNVAYAHNLLSYWDVNYTALDMFGEEYEALDEESRVASIQYTLSYNAFVGIGTNKFTQNDFEQYDTYSEANRFSVIPGTKYFLCAWEIDPATQAPLETFVYEELSTLAPSEVDLGLNVTLNKITDYGMVLNFKGDSEILYVRTCWGMKDMMEAYAKQYGLDNLIGTFGQNWSMEFLAGTGDMQPGVENATWPAYDSGEYIMYVRAYDAQGNMQQGEYVFEYSGSGEVENPTITVYSKEKSEGYVKFNFEISPSNVEEAYVRLLSENVVDDRLNMGYTYPEIAMGGTSIDITNEINRTGEYTYINKEVPEEWNSFIIYAKTKEGGKTTLRINFYPDNDSEWSIYSPFHAPKQMPRINRIQRAGDPSMVRGMNKKVYR